MQLKNTPDTFGAVTKFLHWVIGPLVVILLCVGLYMTNVEDAGLKFKLYPLHKSTGIVVLFLAALRVLWHFYSRTPAFVPSLKSWEKTLARLGHFCLYAGMLGMPLSGWIFSSAAGRTVNVYGLFDLPNLVEKNEALRDFFAEVHGFLGYFLIFVIVLHVVGALKHHIIDKDTTLRRMLPW